MPSVDTLPNVGLCSGPPRLSTSLLVTEPDKPIFRLFVLATAIITPWNTQLH